MVRKERPIIIDLGERHRSDIRDLKRGEGELAYEIDRVIDRVTQELGIGAQSSRSAGVSVGTTGSGAGTTGSSAGTTGSGTSVGFEASAHGEQPSVLPVIVLYSKRGSSRRDEGLFSLIPRMDDDDDRDRDRD